MTKHKKKQKKSTIPAQDLPCEVPKCRNMMGKDGLLFYDKRVCADHFTKDGKRGFSLRKIFNIKHVKTMGGDMLFDSKCPICINNSEVVTAKEQKKGKESRKPILKHLIPLPSGHAHTPIYEVVEQTKI